jgi:hypothetical protein
MARAMYVYLVRDKSDGTRLGCFTVKWEAQTWATARSGRTLDDLQLWRAKDGLYGDKAEVKAEWDT